MLVSIIFSKVVYEYRGFMYFSILYYCYLSVQKMIFCMVETYNNKKILCNVPDVSWDWINPIRNTCTRFGTI